MILIEHQCQYIRGLVKINPWVMELGTNDEILTHSKLLTHVVEDLSNQLSELP